MKDSSDLEKLVSLALTDPAFRKELASDPEKALANHGLKVTRERLAVLRDRDWGPLQDLARAFGEPNTVIN